MFIYILCVQETHWTNNIMEKMKKVWTELHFVNHGCGGACGVAILIFTNGIVNNVKQFLKDD